MNIIENKVKEEEEKYNKMFKEEQQRLRVRQDAAAVEAAAKAAAEATAKAAAKAAAAPAQKN
jgi:hypothetical protein